jgi:hypothetical protein
MSFRPEVVSLALGLLLLASPAPGAEDPSPTPPPRPAVRVYTNADLDRLHPFRGETGVHSTPAEPPAEASPGDTPATPGRGEAYWRREAARVRERVLSLEASAAELRARIEEQREEASQLAGRRRRGPASAGGSSLAGMQARLRSLERRIRAAEDDLLDRARRDRALPGWLR